MGLSHVLVHLLLFQMACSQLTTIPQGFGFVEDETMNLKKCAVLKVNLQIEENSPFAQAMKRNCCGELDFY